MTIWPLSNVWFLYCSIFSRIIFISILVFGSLVFWHWKVFSPSFPKYEASLHQQQSHICVLGPPFKDLCSRRALSRIFPWFCQRDHSPPFLSSSPPPTRFDFFLLIFPIRSDHWWNPNCHNIML